MPKAPRCDRGLCADSICANSLTSVRSSRFGRSPANMSMSQTVIGDGDGAGLGIVQSAKTGEKRKIDSISHFVFWSIVENKLYK